MPIALRVSGLIIWLSLILLQGRLHAAGRVEMELFTSRDSAGTAQQQWYRLLTEVRVDRLRIRRHRTGDEVKIDTGGTPQRRLYRVYGALTPRNQLVLPGGTFSISDRKKLAAWVKQLREKGPNAVDRPSGPFGLSTDDLARATKLLSRPVRFSTAGLNRDVVLGKLRGDVGIPMAVETSLSAAIPRNDRVDYELQGIATGTALAYVLRPAGLIFQPRQGANGDLEFVVMKSSTVDLPWPVGLAADDRRRTLLPSLFDILPVEIQNAPLSEALKTIEERLDVRVLIDENSLKREGIDLSSVNVSLPRKKLSYSLILRKLLFQARLKSELRMDEAKQPFIWVTTLKRP